MGTPGAYPHVQDAGPARGLDLLAQVPVLHLAELEPVEARPPDQPFDEGATLGRSTQLARHLGARPVEPLIRIAPPVGEQYEVARRDRMQLRAHVSEVGPAPWERAHLVAVCDGRPPRRA